MSIIEICKEKAIEYSNKICKAKIGSIFPEYVDWADHIAKDDINGYQFHLNKTVSDFEKLLNIFKKFMPEHYIQWEEEWYEVSVASAWVHDIGMIVDRNNHGTKSAELVIKNDEFNEIDYIDRIKIGILCIKHNRGWNVVITEMKRLLNDSPSIVTDEEVILQLNDIFEEYSRPICFEQKDKRTWPLEFSAKLLCTADSLRYRGTGLRNNLGHSFYLCSQCDKCESVYEYPKSSCSNECNESRLETKALFYHPVFDDILSLYDDGKYFICLEEKKDKEEDKYVICEDKDKSVIYEKAENGRYQKYSKHVTNKEYIRVLVRDANQKYTCGDILLSQVEAMDFDSWYNELKSERIDTNEIDGRIDHYNKIVYRVTMDADNPELALYTFSKYIAEFLADNVLINEPFRNIVILHIHIPNDNIHFKSYLSKLEGYKVYNKIRYLFRRWDNEYNQLVLPLEIDNKFVKDIKL